MTRWPRSTEDGTVGNGVGFQRIRRVTGYLTGDLSRFNDGKKAEERDRVKPLGHGREPDSALVAWGLGFHHLVVFGVAVLDDYEDDCRLSGCRS